MAAVTGATTCTMYCPGACLLDQASGEMDRDKRRRLLFEAQRILNQDLPYLAP